MYVYGLTSGEYADFDESLICYKKKLKGEEFLSMYNKAVRSFNGEYFMHDELADRMCEMFGFFEPTEVFYVNSGYDEFREIPVDYFNNKEEIYVQTKQFRFSTNKIADYELVEDKEDVENRIKEFVKETPTVLDTNDTAEFIIEHRQELLELLK